MTLEGPVPRRPSSWVVALLLSALAVLAAIASVKYSGLFVLAIDACGPDNCGSTLVWAYVVTWGGVALAAIVLIAGLWRSTRRGTGMWIWPVLALVLVGVTFAGGYVLANSLFS